MATNPELTVPHNLEAERSVLGGILIDNDQFDAAAQVVVPDDFFRNAHQRIFSGMIELSNDRNPIDFVTLKDHLGRKGHMEDVGGPAYIASLVDGVPRTTNVEYYAKIVKEKKKRFLRS